MIYVYTLFNEKYPICTGISNNDKITIVDLYKPGTGYIIKKVKKNRNIIRDIILSANKPVVISNFKRHLEDFDFPRHYDIYDVYDIHLPNIETNKPHEVITKVLKSMPNFKIREYNKIMANAAVVYRDLQANGLLLNHTKVFPVWSQNTFSGRSKSTGFNIQGYYEPDIIRPIDAVGNTSLIHFDWICADIRVASILSGDEILAHSFIDSDPYTYMMNIINKDSDNKITRDECKLFLLKSINSMDFDSDAFRIYPKLGEWLYKCKNIIVSGGELTSLFGRKFSRKFAKNDFAILNGVMQGSVANIMQSVVRKAWEELPGQLVAEIHDSLVVCSRDNNIGSTIRSVLDIMLLPFDDYIFPVKVSIGKKWKKWKLYKEFRQ